MSRILGDDRTIPIIYISYDRIPQSYDSHLLFPIYLTAPYAAQPAFSSSWGSLALSLGEKDVL